MRGTTVALVSWPANSEFSIILRLFLVLLLQTMLAVYTPTVTETAIQGFNPHSVRWVAKASFQFGIEL